MTKKSLFSVISKADHEQNVDSVNSGDAKSSELESEDSCKDTESYPLKGSIRSSCKSSSSSGGESHRRAKKKVRDLLLFTIRQRRFLNYANF